MNETRHNGLRNILAFTALAEGGTGLALVIDPAIVITLLLGVNGSDQGVLIGRFLGIALLALGLACWPSGQRAWRDSKTFWAMSIYNLLVALLMAYVGTVGHLGGLLLWPCLVEHTAVALLLVCTWRTERRAKASDC